MNRISKSATTLLRFLMISIIIGGGITAILASNGNGNGNGSPPPPGEGGVTVVLNLRYCTTSDPDVEREIHLEWSGEIQRAVGDEGDETFDKRDEYTANLNTAGETLNSITYHDHQTIVSNLRTGTWIITLESDLPTTRYTTPTPVDIINSPTNLYFTHVISSPAYRGIRFGTSGYPPCE